MDKYLQILSPNNIEEKVLLTIDFACVIVMGVFKIFDLDFFTEIFKFYILFVTSLSISITVAVKLYNLFNSNEKNKKI